MEARNRAFSSSAAFRACSTSRRAAASSPSLALSRPISDLVGLDLLLEGREDLPEVLLALRQQ